MGDYDGCRKACEAGLEQYTNPHLVPTVKEKLENNLAECEKGPPVKTPEQEKVIAEKVEVLKEKKVKQKEEFKEMQQKVVTSEGGIYGDDKSGQKDYVMPGP